jgi:tRNA 5-methylaminomethyl-2-thiouridine biosynthesis bifunctional protein
VPARLSIPDVEWREGVLFSRAHDDAYTSQRGARTEREHVFLRGNGFGAEGDADGGRWKQVGGTGQSRHLIAELGFGTGVTFLSAWAAFRAHAPADAQLDWVSVEGAPLDAATLSCAALSDPAMAPLAPLVAELARALPAHVRGIHRRTFDGGRVRLTLLFGDVLELLPVMDFHADAWCLDGFSPARNAEMWSEEALAQVAAHARVGSTLATYSAASAVGERLSALGFRVARTPGANGKREMISATMERAPDRKCIRTLPKWFAVPQGVGHAESRDTATARVPQPPSTAIVIGAGIAGATAARALAERGLRVTVLDAGRAASGASAAPRAVLAPHLASWQSPQTRIVAHAFLHARAVMERIGAPLDPCGMVHPVNGDDEWGYQQAIADWGWPDDMLRLVQADDATAVAGTPLCSRESPEGALLVRDAGTTRPADTVRAALSHPAITLREQVPVARLHPLPEGWRVDAEDGRTFDAQVLVIATAGIPAGALPEMPEALASDALPSVPFDATRGQLSTLSFDGAAAVPHTVVSANGFAMPPVDGAICAGATFEHERLATPATPHDDAINLGHVERLLPELAACAPARRGAWAGIRTSVHDHCPIAGPVVSDSAFRQAFARLAHGPVAAQWTDAPVLPGLFATLAHGSRGTCTAFLAAELIADMVCGTPRCVADDLLPALLPQRFLVRELRGGARGRAAD